MAVTRIITITTRLDKHLRYVANADKTDDKVFVSAIGCTPKNAYWKMMETKRYYDKISGVQAYHIIQSFKPDEITPELAHELGIRFIKEYLDDYEVLIGTHVDKEHIHNHISFNSVSDATGLKYHSSPASYYQQIRRISDKLCKEYGLSVIINPSQKGLTYAEWKMKKAGLLTYRELFEADLQEALSFAFDIGNFYEIMEDRGYTIEHHSKYPSFVPYGSKGHYRAKIDGKSLTEDDIRNIIEKGYEEEKSSVLIPKSRPVFVPYGKQKGFRALYVSWMYVLGIIGNGGRTPYPKVSYADVKKFEVYKKQQNYLDTHEIDNSAQLDDRMQFLTTQVDTLTKQRIILNQKKKRQKPLYDALSKIEYFADMEKLYAEGASVDETEYRIYLDAKKALEGKDVVSLKQEKAEVYQQLSDINAVIRKARSEIKLCEQIKSTIPRMEDAMHEPDQERFKDKER